MKDRWKICESKFGMRIGWNAFVQGTCANIGEGERYFSKSSRAHDAPARIHYLCVGDRLINQRDSLSQLRISCSQLRDSCIQLRISCSRRKVVRLFQKWYDFSESPTTFPRISCSRCCISSSHHRVSCSRREECASRAQTNHIDQWVEPQLIDKECATECIRLFNKIVQYV